MDELWKPITGFVGLYEVSNLGKIRSVDRTVIRNNSPAILKGRALKLKKSSDGYFRICLSRESKLTFLSIHRLVAEHFLPPRRNEQIEINHLDLNKENNSAANLEWVTRKENMQHAASHGRFNPFANPRNAIKLTPDSVLAIRHARTLGLTYKAIGEQFDIHQSTARDIAILRKWKPI